MTISHTPDLTLALWPMITMANRGTLVSDIAVTLRLQHYCECNWRLVRPGWVLLSGAIMSFGLLWV